MKCSIFIDNKKIGEAELIIIDESMGAIGGIFIPNDAYFKFQTLVQDQCDKKGISNISDFNYRIALPEDIDLNSKGGIGISHVQGINEIYVDSAGLDVDQLKQFK
jgi:hypothetical protein